MLQTWIKAQIFTTLASCLKRSQNFFRKTPKGMHFNETTNFMLQTENLVLPSVSKCINSQLKKMTEVGLLFNKDSNAIQEKERFRRTDD